MKRTLACLLLCAVSYFSFSQPAKKFDLHFVVKNTATKKYLKQIDSVTLRNEITGEEWVFDNLQTKDSVFKIEEVDLGKYRVAVYQKNLVIPFMDFSLCTICRNKVNFLAYTSTANMVFDRVSIGPHYEAGFKQLANDFLSGLTKEEIKTLKKTENKLKVKCFITADDKLSDVIFDQADLPEEIKKLILKGFEKTKNWRCGIAASKPIDDFISLAVHKIVD